MQNAANPAFQEFCALRWLTGAQNARQRSQQTDPLMSDRSARRPGHLAAAEQVEVQVVDGLAAIPAAVHDDAIAALQLLLFREVANHEPHVSQQLLIAVIERCDGRDRALGDYEDVNMLFAFKLRPRRTCTARPQRREFRPDFQGVRARWRCCIGGVYASKPTPVDDARPHNR
jgi:hypothetical protein